MVFNHPHERLVVLETDPRLSLSVFCRNLQRSVGAAVVDDRVLPVGLGLTQHTLDAFTKMGLTVVHGRDHAN